MYVDIYVNICSDMLIYVNMCVQKRSVDEEERVVLIFFKLRIIVIIKYKKYEGSFIKGYYSKDNKRFLKVFCKRKRYLQGEWYDKILKCYIYMGWRYGLSD